MKRLAVLLCLVLFLLLPGCGDIGEETEETGEIAYDVLHPIRITAGDTELSGVLYDNSFGRTFSETLPITVSLWIPADFAKAFDLANSLEGEEPLTRRYVPGGLAYWSPGPSVAIFHAPEQERTAVPVVHIGKIDEGEEFFADYTGKITIEAIQETEGE